MNIVSRVFCGIVTIVLVVVPSGPGNVAAQTTSCASATAPAAPPAGLTASAITVDTGAVTGVSPTHAVVPIVDGDAVALHVTLNAATATTTQVLVKDDQGQTLDSATVTIQPGTPAVANLANIGSLPSTQLQCVSLWAGTPAKPLGRLYFLQFPARTTLSGGTDAADGSISGLSATASGVYTFTNLGIDAGGHLRNTAHLASDPAGLKWLDLRLKFDGDVDPGATSFDVPGSLQLPQALGNGRVTLPHVTITAAQIATTFTDQNIPKFLGLSPARLKDASLAYTFGDKKFTFTSSVEAQLASVIGAAAQPPAPDATPAANALHSTDSLQLEENGSRLGVKGSFKLNTTSTAELALLYLHREQFIIDNMTTSGRDLVQTSPGQQYFHVSGKIQFVGCLFKNPLTFTDLPVNASGDSLNSVPVPEVIKIGFIKMPKVNVLMKQWQPYFTIEIEINRTDHDTITTPAPVSAADIVAGLRRLFNLRRNTVLGQAATAVQNACQSVQNETR